MQDSVCERCFAEFRAAEAARRAQQEGARRLGLLGARGSEALGTALSAVGAAGAAAGAGGEDGVVARMLRGRPSLPRGAGPDRAGRAASVAAVAVRKAANAVRLAELAANVGLVPPEEYWDVGATGALGRQTRACTCLATWRRPPGG